MRTPSPEILSKNLTVSKFRYNLDRYLKILSGNKVKFFIILAVMMIIQSNLTLYYNLEGPGGLKIWLVMLIALFTSAAIAIAVILLYDRKGSRFRRLSYYYHFFDIPLFGTIPHQPENKAHFSGNLSEEEFKHWKDDFSELVPQIINLNKLSGYKLFSICSLSDNEGKTMISHNLALVLTLKKKKVLLVDMDSGESRLTKDLQLSRKPGLTELISGKCTAEEICHPTGLDNLDITGMGNLENHNSHTDFPYNHAAFVYFLSMAQSQYDIIIFDTPSITHAPQSIQLMAKMDAVLLLLRLRHTSRRSFEKLLVLTSHYEKKIIGTILNDYKM